jgi:hypothetical protein
MHLRAHFRIKAVGKNGEHELRFAAMAESALAAAMHTASSHGCPRGNKSPASTAGLQSAMEASECMSKHQRHEQDAGSECEHVRGFA